MTCLRVKKENVFVNHLIPRCCFTEMKNVHRTLNFKLETSAYASGSQPFSALDTQNVGKKSGGTHLPRIVLEKLLYFKNCNQNNRIFHKNRARLRNTGLCNA